MSAHDLPVSPLPLSKQLRDELDASIRKSKQAITKIILISQDPIEVNELSTDLLLRIIWETKALLLREGLKDVLQDHDITTEGDLRQMLEQQPQLLDIIHAACEASKFAHIMDLQLLHKPTPVSPPKASEEDEVTKVKNLNESFRRPYVGEAAEGFFQYLASNNEKFSENISRPYYGKFCSIVQSSGTGKSRLLTELRNRDVIVLYMNLREPSDSGFPHRDKIPCKILTENVQCSQAEYTARCCTFFAAVFRMLKRELLELLRPGISTQAVINAWNDRMCDMLSPHRTKFFDEVQKEYLAILHKINVTKKSEQVRTDTTATTIEALEKISLTEREVENKAESQVETPQLEGQSFLTEAYDDMVDKLVQIFTTSHNPQLVIGIDEAHSLSKMSSEGFRPSHILCRAISAYSVKGKGSTWVVFASTTCKVAAFSAPQPIHDSLRVAAAGQLLYPPYTHLGWDQNADALVDISANDIAKFDHIAGFGRPLWKSLIMKGETVNSILTVAKQKLCKSNSGKFESLEDQALALLSQRFALDICFGHPDAVSYIETSIASHLRVCYSTTQDRTWCFTGYPSEPLVSCAAANLLHEKPSNLTFAFNILREKVDGGMFEIGQSGELTTRLLLLLAKDILVRKIIVSNNPYIETQSPDHNNSWKAELIDCRNISVVDFLEHLFGDSFWTKVGNGAKEAFKYAYVNFSHWVPMDGLISPTGLDASDKCTAEEWTLRHWHRSSAVQCCHRQPLVDKMIPIYFDDPSRRSHGSESDINCVSQIFVSDKAGKTSSKQKTNSITRGDPSINCISSRPWIALLLDLNGKSHGVSATFPKKVHHLNETDPCLRIYASGISRGTFPFLGNLGIEEQLVSLISKPKEASSNERLHALVKYGSTVEMSHMKWEAQHVDMHNNSS